MNLYLITLFIHLEGKKQTDPYNWCIHIFITHFKFKSCTITIYREKNHVILLQILERGEKTIVILVILWLWWGVHGLMNTHFTFVVQQFPVFKESSRHKHHFNYFPHFTYALVQVVMSQIRFSSMFYTRWQYMVCKM